MLRGLWKTDAAIAGLKYARGHCPGEDCYSSSNRTDGVGQPSSFTATKRRMNRVRSRRAGVFEAKPGSSRLLDLHTGNQVDAQPDTR